MKQNKIFFSFLFAFLLLGSFVSADIVEQHTNIGGQAIDNSFNSPITQAILPYEDYYHVCNILVDISVVDYVTLEESSNFFETLYNIVTLKIGIGNQYKATHSVSALNRMLNIAGDNQKLRACAYGAGAHLIIDSLSHNKLVPHAIEKTYLVNGLVHSPKEIYQKNLFTSIEDRKYSREVLDLAKEQEIVDFFEEVFVDDPALSQVNIPELIDFFRVQVQSDQSGGYELGFKSFFALPKFVYVFLLIWFLFSLSLLGLTVRKMREGFRDAPTVFISIFGFVFLLVSGLAIYGLFSASLWKLWEQVSQYIFSPYMYIFASIFLLFAGYLIFNFIVKPKKKDNIGNILVAIFLLMLGAYMILLPTGLESGNEKAIYDLQVSEVTKMLNQGSNYVLTFEDPAGASNLAKANEKGSLERTIYLWTLFALFIGIIYFTFKKKKNTGYEGVF